MNGIHQQIELHLNELHKDKNVDALRRASHLAEDIHPDSVHDIARKRELRQSKLEALLTVLAGIDQELDPAFDPKDLPLLTVAPPVVGGVVLDSGIAPQHVKDPKVRKMYEEAIAQNHEKAKRYGFQTAVRRLDRELTLEVERIIAEPHSTTEQGQREIGEAVERIVKNRDRKARLKELLNKKQA
jgi:hypothetical protein